MKNAQTYPFINALLSAWKATGKPMGIDAYLRITQLIEALPDETNLADLKTLLAPIIVGSPQQQADFYETFDRVLKNFDVQTSPPVQEPIFWKKALKWVGLGIAAAIMAWLLWLLYVNIFPPKKIESPVTYLRLVVDMDRDAAGRKDSIRQFLGLQYVETPLTVKTFEIKELSNNTHFVGKYIALDIDTVAKTLFYKPIAIGDDTFQFKYCLSNDTCYERNYIFSVQHIERSGSTGGGWDDKIPLKPYNHQPDISTLRVNEEASFSLKNAYMSAWKWLILLFVTGFLGSIYYLLKVRQDKQDKQKRDEQDAATLNRKPNTAPPFIWQMKIKDAEKVNFDAVFNKITTQLRRRSEIDYRIFDPKRTIKATIDRAGLATFRYRQPTRADEYLFLIDVHNANDHRAQVFDLLYRTLLKSEVLIERFFYDGDLRLCWNEAHPHGIRLNELAQRFGTARLVVVGSGATLMNPNVHELAEWTRVFDEWRQRVLLTTRSPAEWNAVERTLATKFRILPGNMRGLEAMPDTFDALDAPDFRKWRTVKDPDFEPIRLPDVLNEEAIMAHLEMVFMVYKNGKTDNRLLLWLAACAVPPVLHWDTTLFFGNLIDERTAQKGDVADLVSLDNLFKINRLSWFLEGKLPDKARRALLDFLEKRYPSVIADVRAAWDIVLKENLEAARKAAEERGEDFDKSVAFDDLRLQMIVNDLKRGGLDADKRQALLTELRGLTRGGKRDDMVALEILANEIQTPTAPPSNPSRRPLWQRVLMWALPLWLVAFLGIWCYQSGGQCDGAKVKYRGNVLCIASERDYLVLSETYETEFLSRDTSTIEPIDSTNELRFTDLVMQSRAKYEDTIAADKDIRDRLTFLNALRGNGMDSASYCRNVAIGYYNVAINYLNKGNRDSACIAYQFLKGWHWKDSVLTKGELQRLEGICTPQNPVQQQKALPKKSVVKPQEPQQQAPPQYKEPILPTSKVPDIKIGNLPYKPLETVENATRQTQNAVGNDPKAQQSIAPIETVRETIGKVTFDMVKVKGGTFKMGSEDKDAGDDEKPVHDVTLSDFYIGQTEVTQKQWRDVMGSDPPELNFEGCDNCPVENVSWDDVQEFLKKLNSQSKTQFRLPTEAEWEFSARGGNASKGFKYSGSDNVDEVAWYGYEKSEKKTHPVATKKANELGLFDMSGNVWELCSDWYGDYNNGASRNPKGAATRSYRVFRGGGWFSGAGRCRVAYRNYGAPANRTSHLGFRLASSSPQ